MGVSEGVSPAGSPVSEGQEPGITRRVVLRDGSAVALALMLTGPASGLADVAVPVASGRRAFLNETEMNALRGLVDRFIPGRPEDLAEGALAGGCAEAINGLLSAFRYRRPRIYAGAPFSDRAGSKVNHFEKFLRLDPYEERAWRLRVQGSRGKRRLEFNGPVKGWQQTYREGLAALDEAAAPQGFGDLPSLGRDLILETSGDPRIADLVDVAWPHTWQFMYGAPEYGGNRDELGWKYTNFAGDVQPRGWTKEEIETSEPGERRPTRALIPPGLALAEVLALTPLAGGEAAWGLVARSGDSLAAMRAELDAITRFSRRGGLDGS